MKGNARLAERHLRGQPGLSQAARRALLDLQPATVVEALRLRGVGRKTTARLLLLGVLRDPGGVQQGRPVAAERGIEP
jgi:hypothetical protein